MSDKYYFHGVHWQDGPFRIDGFTDPDTARAAAEKYVDEHGSGLTPNPPIEGHEDDYEGGVFRDGTNRFLNVMREPPAWRTEQQKTSAADAIAELVMAADDVMQDVEPDYRMDHRPADRSGIPLHDLTVNMPADVYDHPEWYDPTGGGRDDPSFGEAWSAISKARNNPDAKIRIYRSLPAEHIHQGIRPGDWVTTSKSYALQHGRHATDPNKDWPVIRTTVRAGDLHTDADDLREWGYNGDQPHGGMVAFKGGREQEVRLHADGTIHPVQRRSQLGAMATAEPDDGHLVLYHGTTRDRLPGIQEKGLTSIPGSPAGWFMLTDSKEQAERYTSGRPGGVVLEYHIPKRLSDYREDGALLWPGRTTDVYGYHAMNYAPKESIPASYIKGVHEAPVDPSYATAAVSPEPDAQSYLDQRYPGLDHDVSERPDSIVLHKVVVPKEQRGQGIGSAYMRDLTDYADSKGKRVELTPDTSFGGSSKGRLQRFYKGFGFVPNKDLSISNTMVRPASPGRQQTTTDRAQAVKFAKLAWDTDDPDLHFHVQASWRDVRDKAKRIRADGGVRILADQGGEIVAQVHGDHGIYQSEITFLPGSRSTAAWSCSCPYAAFAWGRTGQFKKLEGRRCLVPETMISMADGTFKPISEVQVGEYVVTHDGIGQVTDTMVKPFQGDLVALSSDGDPRPITMTGDHEVWGHGTPQRLRKSWQNTKGQGFKFYDESFLHDESPRWIEAGNMQTYDWLTGVVRTHTHGGPFDVSSVLDEYEIEGDRIYAVYRHRAAGQTRYQGSLDATIRPSHALARIAGLYLAEGNIAEQTGRIAEIQFSVSADEADELTKMLDEALADLGSPGRVRQYGRKNHSGKSIRVTNRPLAQLMAVLCGRGVQRGRAKSSIGKRIHPWVMAWSPEHQHTLLDALHWGDGNHGDHSEHVIEKKVFTSDNHLAQQVVDMVHRCGMVASWSGRWQKGGPSSRDKQFWINTVRWSEVPSYSNGRRWNGSGRFAAKITRTENVPYDGPVHDLTVYPQHSYVANGRVVHNCSHVLALQFEAQARGMFGKDITLDVKTPHWLDPDAVKVPGEYDRDKGRHAAALRPLPMANGTYYRLQAPGRQFSREDASTRNNGEPIKGMEKYWDKKPGYSAFWSPHHLHQYLDDMGWDEGAKGSKVIRFQGTPVGEGGDGEPRVMPKSDRPDETMSPKQFSDRLDISPDTGTHYTDHTWGDGPDGPIVDDGYRSFLDLNKGSVKVVATASERPWETLLMGDIPFHHVTRRPGPITALPASEAGESGPGVYLAGDPEYAQQMSSWDPAMRSLNVTVHAGDGLSLLDRTKPGGEEEYRRLQGENGHPQKGLAETLHSHGYDGVRNLSPGNKWPETVIHDPSKLVVQDPQGQHAEQRTAAVTSWDTPQEKTAAADTLLHRGVSVETDPYELREIHAQGGMAAVQDHLRKLALRQEGLGTHWTSRPEIAQEFAAGSNHGDKNNPEHGQRTYMPYVNTMQVPVVLHGRIDPQHYETDPEKLRDAMVEGQGWNGLHNRNESETLVKPGAPVNVTGMEAALPADPQWMDKLGHELDYADDPTQWDPGKHTWQGIGDAGVHHTAAVTINYMRNNGGMRGVKGFGQDVEPWGKYMSEQDPHVPPPDGWEHGQVTFTNPLRLEHEDGGWKQRLSQQHGGLVGKELSQALLAKGHDAVITHDKYGTGEIVDLRPEQGERYATGALSADDSTQVGVVPSKYEGHPGHPLHELDTPKGNSALRWHLIDQHGYDRGDIGRSPKKLHDELHATEDGIYHPAFNVSYDTIVHHRHKTAANYGDPGTEDLASSPFITRGFIASPDHWEKGAAERIRDLKATPEDILSHIDTADVGDFWHGHADSTPDAQDYASVDKDTHVGTEASDPENLRYTDGRGYLGELGVALVAHRPAGWDPNTNEPEMGGLMGNSYLPHTTDLKLHEIHYSDPDGNWHAIPAEGHSVHATGYLDRRAVLQCPADGQDLEFDLQDGWQHLDGSVSHDDGLSVTDHMQQAGIPLVPQTDAETLPYGYDDLTEFREDHQPTELTPEATSLPSAIAYAGQMVDVLGSLAERLDQAAVVLDHAHVEKPAVGFTDIRDLVTAATTEMLDVQDALAERMGAREELQRVAGSPGQTGWLTGTATEGVEPDSGRVEIDL